jgi:hypothetical protein
MKFSCLLFFLVFAFFSSAQSVALKKKYLKTYVGKIPSYDVSLNNEIIPVKPIEIEIHISKDSLIIKVGSAKWQGTYTASKIERKKFEIIGKMDGSGVPETLFLDAKNKTMTRKGLFPQPDATLDKRK